VRHRLVALALLVSSACAAPDTPSPRAPASTAANGAWTYEIVATAGAEELAVDASFPPGTLDELTVEEGGEPFVRDVELQNAGHWTRVAPDGTSWMAPSCANGCRVRYRYLLRAAGRANGSVSIARAHHGAVEAPPSTWLLRPIRAKPGTPFRFHVTSAPGEAFATGVFPANGAKDTYAATAEDAFQLPYSAFGRIRVRDVESGRVQVALLPGFLPNEAEVLGWVETSARVVASYYGRPPTPRLLVVVRPTQGDGVGFGTTIGNAGAAIAIDVGAAATREDLAADWVLVHEMVHTALPDLRGPHHWLEEGLATYVEPLARARAGLITPEDVWHDWVHGMPNGLPAEGDEGLDRTRTWGRTYWGGALFCLLADLDIRARTGGAKSLDDALRAIVQAGGSIATTWPIDRVVEVGDAATGVPVLRELYGRMANAPSPVDLDALWKRLGVVPNGRAITFDDGAPLASTRQAMTAAR
jgi:hypothetical protein